MTATGGGHVISQALEAGAALGPLVKVHLDLDAPIGADRHVTQFEVELFARPPSYEESSN